jgi:hypothetical protein
VYKLHDVLVRVDSEDNAIELKSIKEKMEDLESECRLPHIDYDSRVPIFWRGGT